MALVIVLIRRGTDWGGAHRIMGTSVSCFSPSPPHAQAIPPPFYIVRLGIKYRTFKHLELQEVILFSAWCKHV